MCEAELGGGRSVEQGQETWPSGLSASAADGRRGCDVIQKNVLLQKQTSLSTQCNVIVLSLINERHCNRLYHYHRKGKLDYVTSKLLRVA